MKALVGLMFFTFSIFLSDGWALFEKVKFKAKYSQLYNEFFQYPQFDSAIRAYQGKEITLEGYYIPFDLVDSKSIVVSKFPYAACFFCGGAGPESVAEVVFTKSKPRLKADQLITVKGMLRLNEDDVSRMTFILEDATIIKD
jgi:hypothetical protein